MKKIVKNGLKKKYESAHCDDICFVVVIIIIIIIIIEE